MQNSTGTKDWQRITREERHLFGVSQPKKSPTVLFLLLGKRTAFSGICYPSLLLNPATLLQNDYIDQKDDGLLFDVSFRTSHWHHPDIWGQLKNALTNDSAHFQAH